MHGWSQSSLGEKRAWNVFFTDTVTSSLSLCLYLFFLKWILYRHLSIWPFSNNISSSVEQLHDQVLQSRPKGTSNCTICSYFNKHDFTFSNPIYSISVLPAPTLYPYPFLIHASPQHFHINYCVLYLQPGPAVAADHRWCWILDGAAVLRHGGWLDEFGSGEVCSTWPPFDRHFMFLIM